MSSLQGHRPVIFQFLKGKENRKKEDYVEAFKIGINF
jgi:hypothetical protein